MQLFSLNQLLHLNDLNFGLWGKQSAYLLISETSHSSLTKIDFVYSPQLSLFMLKVDLL